MLQDMVLIELHGEKGLVREREGEGRPVCNTTDTLANI
jgi:hypothetical protein